MFSASGSDEAFVEPVPTAQRSSELPFCVEVKQLRGDAGAVLYRRMPAHHAHQTRNRAAREITMPDNHRIIRGQMIAGQGELFEISKERSQSRKDHGGWCSKPFVVHREDLLIRVPVAGAKGNSPIRETYAKKKSENH